MPIPPGANPLVAERAFPTSDYWGRTGVARCAEEMTGESVRISNRLLTPCHTRLRRPPRDPFSYQGVSTRGVRHSPDRGELLSVPLAFRECRNIHLGPGGGEKSLVRSFCPDVGQGESLRGVAFMTVLAVLTALVVSESTLASFRLSYKIQDKEAPVTVLAVSVVTASPLSQPPFSDILMFKSPTGMGGVKNVPNVRKVGELAPKVAPQRLSGKSKWGLSNGGLRPLPTLWPFWAPFFGELFLHEMRTIVGNRGQLWTSTLSPHLLSPHSDSPETWSFDPPNRGLSIESL